MRCWYLVYTKHSEEFRAQLNLERQHFSTYLPKLLKPTKSPGDGYRIVPFFARYLFIEINHEQDDVSKVSNTKGIVGLVKFGNLPARVTPDIIDQVKIAEDRMNDRLKKIVASQQHTNNINNFCTPNKEARVLVLLDAVNKTHTTNTQIKRVASV